MPGFQLIKWYADLVDPATGQLIIAYDSTLRWKSLAFHFTNLLHCRPPAAPRSRASFVQTPTATLNPAGTEFTLRQRGLHGVWQQQAPAIRELLLDTPQGSVLWECFLPAATAQVTLDDAACAGLGYVERLTLTLPPWQLPLATLRWGRFVAATHAVVWIRWDGPEPRHLIFHNGRRYDHDGHIGDEGLQFGPFALTFQARHPLRAGAVGDTVFRRFPWFGRLFPARILRLEEVKWLSAATLTGPGLEPVAGYAVHERVAWPS